MIMLLTCDCGSHDFVYGDATFTCKICGQTYHEEEAGKHLLGEEEVI